MLPVLVRKMLLSALVAALVLGLVERAHEASLRADCEALEQRIREAVGARSVFACVRGAPDLSQEALLRGRTVPWLLRRVWPVELELRKKAFEEVLEREMEVNTELSICLLCLAAVVLLVALVVVAAAVCRTRAVDGLRRGEAPPSGEDIPQDGPELL